MIEHQCRHAGGPRRQLQPSRRRQVEAADVPQHPGEGSAAQPFLHGPQHVRRAAGIDHHHPVGLKAEGGDAGGIGRRPDPQYRPRQRREAGSGSGGCRTITLQPTCRQPPQQHGGEGDGGTVRNAVLVDMAADLVQAANGEAAPRQGDIHLRHPQGHGPSHGVATHPFQGGDASAQSGEIRG